ncbi:phasin family protein [Neptunomonas qingdaonensis]|uniref:Phasin protein n=1 Tax=Neptunomonas qingdaonensis TaxID=1045558 RepID=A0A1I2U931_9GAMM|nr:phasin family protein [Neptunomonas qingdaonensis]SFG73674.1 Phasin protein [Neptunomonas qingdaonensis]
MFQDMTKIMSESIEPFKELVNIQTRMLEELTRQQMECTKSCINATIQQTKQLQQCKTANDLLLLQQSYAQELEETLKDASEENLKSLHEARDEIEKITKNAFNAFASE